MILAALCGASSELRADPQPLTAVTVTGEPVAPPAAQEGTGLCAAYRATDNADARFPASQDRNQFSQDVNSFMEMAGGVGIGPRIDQTLRTRFDLSNDVTMGGVSSGGDFSMADVSCALSGCPFPVKDPMLPGIGARFRGFLNVPAGWANVPIHFGFYADDAVSLTILDKSKVRYNVVARGPKLGTVQWRTTNSVSFKTPGLYPVEVVYAQIDVAAALEFAVLVNQPFADVEEAPKQGAGQTTLRDAGFQLAAPTLFFQSVLGVHPFSQLTACQQCPRSNAGVMGGGPRVGCPDPTLEDIRRGVSGFFCNEAAVCAPCREGNHCGSSCMPCMAPTPVCTDSNGTQICVQCEKDPDCDLTYPGQNRKCDKATKTCNECNVDPDCPKGKRCESNKCVDCSTDSQCAGASCSCCPKDAPRCIDGGGGQFVCSQCRLDADCDTGKKCDLQNRRCVEKVADCNTDDRCGSSCAPCPKDQVGESPPRPFCLEGKVCVQCRSDLDCGPGRSCLSGDCVPCSSDRRCGASCRSCGGDTPYCKPGGAAETSTCVRCLTDAQCGTGGTCDLQTNTCSQTCEMSCARGTWCDGQRCVECYAATHCPCGGSCNFSINKCSDECEDTGDCLPTQCCSKTTKQCVPGRCKPGVGVLCCEAAPSLATDPAGEPPGTSPGARRAAAAALALLCLMALFALRGRLGRAGAAGGGIAGGSDRGAA